ncbi:MAG: Flp family type IVb pilin [Chloroflexota bacterium]
MTARISDAMLRFFALYKDEEGQALAEYAIILGLVMVVAVAALTLLGVAVAGRFGPVTSALGGGGSS